MDRREEILWRVIKEGPYNQDDNIPIAAITESMDEYMKECALELLGYIGKKCHCFDYDESGQLQFQLKDGGQWCTKEQLFENFL